MTFWKSKVRPDPEQQRLRYEDAREELVGPIAELVNIYSYQKRLCFGVEPGQANLKEIRKCDKMAQETLGNVSATLRRLGFPFMERADLMVHIREAAIEAAAVGSSHAQEAVMQFYHGLHAKESQAAAVPATR